MLTRGIRRDGLEGSGTKYYEIDQFYQGGEGFGLELTNFNKRASEEEMLMF